MLLTARQVVTENTTVCRQQIDTGESHVGEIWSVNGTAMGGATVEDMGTAKMHIEQYIDQSAQVHTRYIYSSPSRIDERRRPPTIAELGHKIDDPYTHVRFWDKDNEAIGMRVLCSRCLHGMRICSLSECQPLSPEDRAIAMARLDKIAATETELAYDYGMAPPTVIENVRMKDGRPVMGSVEPMRTGITALACDWMTRQWRPLA